MDLLSFRVQFPLNTPGDPWRLVWADKAGLAMDNQASGAQRPLASRTSQDQEATSGAMCVWRRKYGVYTYHVTGRDAPCSGLSHEKSVSTTSRVLASCVGPTSLTKL
jgi:hypothetical protein